jgi:NAD(P)-dependent dehydrogenase (short-subunit alcohol dehydrogenase family)
MNRDPGRTAVIVGASSGIGALARQLNRDGWRLGLVARRLDRLEALRLTLAPDTVVRRMDVTGEDAAAILDGVLDELGGVDLIIIGAGEAKRAPNCGHRGAAGLRGHGNDEPERPLPTAARRLLVSSPAMAARQILRAVRKKAKHAYIPRRYALVACLLRVLPRPG